MKHYMVVLEKPIDRKTLKASSLEEAIYKAKLMMIEEILKSEVEIYD